MGIFLLDQQSRFAQMTKDIILTDISLRYAVIDSLKSFRNTEKFCERSLGREWYTGVHNYDTKAVLADAVNNAIDTTITMLKAGPISTINLYTIIKPFWQRGDPSELRLDTDDAETFFLYFEALFRYLQLEFSSDKIEMT